MSLETEELILSSFLANEEYTREVIPFAKEEYFEDNTSRVVFTAIKSYFDKFNKIPAKNEVLVDILDRKDLSESTAKAAPQFLDKLQALSSDGVHLEWALEKTEAYFQKRALYLAIIKSIRIIEKEEKGETEERIPSLLQEALNVGFNFSIGHEYIDDFESRFEFYKKRRDTRNHISFSLNTLNKITGDTGMRPKSLTCVAAATGGGKSIFLCDTTAHTLLQGKNVLYITLEMSEESIAERIDANLFDINIGEIKDLDKFAFERHINSIRKKSCGRLVIKEFPTGNAHVGHFRLLLQELKQKKNFKPDLICVDYLNLCAPGRIKMSGGYNSYTIIKCIAEELRGLAVENNIPILTATQLNRSGISNSDVEMTDTSESMGLVHTLDLYFALIRTEELDELGQVMIKQLKNRYGDLNYYRRFVVGLDFNKMRFNDLSNPAVPFNKTTTAEPPQQDKPLFGSNRSTPTKLNLGSLR